MEKGFVSAGIMLWPVTGQVIKTDLRFRDISGLAGGHEKIQLIAG
jgi:hypothetical protein